MLGRRWSSSWNVVAILSNGTSTPSRIEPDLFFFHQNRSDGTEIRSGHTRTVIVGECYEISRSAGSFADDDRNRRRVVQVLEDPFYRFLSTLEYHADHRN